MPYIAIKSYPKDKETKEKLVERIDEVLQEVLGCPPQAVTVSFEEIEPEKWVDTVVKTEIEPNMDKMMIVSGEKKF